MERKSFYLKFLVFTILFIFSSISLAQENSGNWPKRILITNDDGIDNVRIKLLARAFAKISETYVVAPLRDRSGGSNYSPGNKILLVESRMLGEGIHAYGVDGFPADCIMLALFGLMRDKPPDLVISGINSGPNLGEGWFGSGTIGAARMAALLGIPAIAVSSGLHTDTPEALDSAISWLVSLAQSDLVRKLKPPQYLTIDIPPVTPTKIKGVRFTERSAPISLDERMKLVTFRKLENAESGKSHKTNSSYDVWKAEINLKDWWEYYKEDYARDISLYKSGYVVVVPMIADEIDYKFLTHLKNNSKMLPDWKWPIKNR